MNREKIVRLRAIMKSGGNESNAIDAIQSKFLQVVLALLITFVWAWAITNAESKARIDQAKGAVKAYRGKVKVLDGRITELEGTPIGEAILKEEEAIKNLQWVKLLRAIDERDYNERLKMGLSIFTKVQGDELVFSMDDVLRGDQIINRKLIDGCNYAKAAFSIRNWPNAWRETILLELEFRLKNTSETSFPHFDVLHPENEANLNKEIRRRIDQLIKDMHSLQWKASDHLIRYYQANPDKVKTKEIEGHLARFRNGQVADVESFTRDLHNMVKKHVRAVFLKNDVELLNTVLEAY